MFLFMEFRMKAVLLILWMALGIVTTPARAGFDEGAVAFNNKDYATAFREFQAVAQQGDSRGQNGLGVLFENGWGVRKDIKAAIQWYGLAAAQGSAISQFNLAIINENGNGITQNFQEAMRLYRLSAEQGFAMPKFNIGYMYEIGRGVPKDLSEAARWYRIAADQGLGRAQKRLGYFYATGQGVPLDRREGARWYRLAADQGDAEAQYRLGAHYDQGQGVPKDTTEARKWYQLAANQGYEAAQKALASAAQRVEERSSDSGDVTSNSDPGKKELQTRNDQPDRTSPAYRAASSDRWPMSRIVAALKAAAERGDPEGQAAYGRLFKSGEGVPKDFRQSLYWEKKAAEQGLASAQASLGTLYYYGHSSEGIEKNRAEALSWFGKAAQGGYDHAQYMFGVMLADGDGIEKDLRKAVYWLEKAAAQDNSDATLKLQKLRTESSGVGLGAQSTNNDIESLRKRAQQGEPEAQRKLGDKLYSGKGLPKDQATGIEWLRKALPFYIRKAEQGFTEYQYELGNMLWHINRGPHPECFIWYKMAAAQGHIKSISALEESPEILR